MQLSDKMSALPPDGEGPGNKRKRGALWLLAVPSLLAVGLALSFSYSSWLVTSRGGVPNGAQRRQELVSKASVMPRGSSSSLFSGMDFEAMDISGPERASVLRMSYMTDEDDTPARRFQPWPSSLSIPPNISSLLGVGSLLGNTSTTNRANRADKSSDTWLKKCRELPSRNNGRQIKLKQLGLPLHKGPGDLAKGQDVFVDQLSELPRDLRSIPRRMLPRSADAIASRLKRKSCAIVGNSGNVLLSSHGRDIDGHDVVFRVNQGPTAGFEGNVGRKTHFRLLNAWWTENYAGAYDLKKLPLERNVVLIASRGATLSRNFKKLGARMASEGRRDVTATILNLSALSRTRQLLRLFRKCLEATGQKYGGGIAPTSGLVLITNVMDLCQKTSVYGFGDEKVGGRTPKYQYYGGRDARASGNPTHSFETELNLVHALASNNYIRLCAAGSCRGSGTNKARK